MFEVELFEEIEWNIEKGEVYYNISEGNKDSNGNLIYRKSLIEINDIPDDSGWEEKTLIEKNLHQLNKVRRKIKDLEEKLRTLRNRNNRMVIALDRQIKFYWENEKFILSWFIDRNIDMYLYIPEVDEQIDYGIPYDEFVDLNITGKIKQLVKVAREDEDRDPIYWKNVFFMWFDNKFYTQLGRVRMKLTGDGIKRPFSTNGMSWYGVGKEN